jgi:predicted permease
MIEDKILDIIAITIPVFSLVFIGKALGVKKIVTEESRKSLSWITYYLALPALILGVFLESDSSKLFTLNIFLLSIIPIAVSSIAMFLTLLPFKVDIEKKSATIYCSYWGNNGYMGIPLVAAAIGSLKGVAIAAVVNGMTVPFYIAISVFMMIRCKSEEAGEHSVIQEVVKVFKNPVIITLLTGTAISYFHIPQYIHEHGGQIGGSILEIILILTKKLGSMGLPLALILVGSRLNFSEIKADKLLLALSITGKLLIAPLSVFIGVKLFAPDLDKDIFIALILLNAVPSAVASYIISARYKVAEDFVSSMLVLSTAISIITIPVWLYFIL